MNTQLTAPEVLHTTIKQRLLTLLELLLEDSQFNKPTQTIIRTLARNFLGDKVTEEDLRTQVIKIRDEIIPLILGEPGPRDGR